MSGQDDYQIRLETFQGPLDLLLYLIRRAEVDVHDIPIADITEQYLGVLKQVDIVDIDLAGEFLVMAATLIEIKSRSLVPAEVPSGGDGGGRDGKSDEPLDPRFELVQQLLAYQRFRDASEDLDTRRIEFADRYPNRPARRRPGPEAAEPVELDLEDIHLLDLQEAYERVASSIDFAKLGDHHVADDDTPIALHQEDLLDRLRHTTGARMTLQDSFEGREPIQRVGLFLAMLELTRIHRIRVTQDEIENDIAVELIAENDGPLPEAGNEAPDDGSESDTES